MEASIMLIVLMAATPSAVLGEDVTAKTDKGTVRGIRVDTDVGLYYYSFTGIRYAKAPVEELRFKDPVEAGEYDEEFDATDDGHVCPQFDIGTSKPIGDEDCLNLNVFTPKLDGAKRPVIVFIHGGSFITGAASSATYGPKYILQQDVVLVTLNYRLGAFGFLATADKAAKGNFGIKDQIMALKWVKSNAAAFGGDPNKVTIFGNDAGAASVTVHVLSPASKGLFHNAVAMSGSVNCDQYFQPDPQRAAADLGDLLDCDSTKGQDIVSCLRKQTQQDIVLKMRDMFTFFAAPAWFVPSVDGTVLTDEPAKMLADGIFNKVPVFTGQTKNEGAFFYRLVMNTFTNRYDDNFLDHKLPRILPLMSSFTARLYPITRHVRKKYFVNVDMESEDEFRPKFIDFLTDIMFTRCVNSFVNALANAGVTVYYYSFDHRGQYSISNLLGEQDDMGVSHLDDVQYFFEGVWGDDMTASKSDLKFTNDVAVPLVTNFAKTGVPVPATTDAINVIWDPVSPGKNNVYRIGDKLAMENDFKQDALRFWNEEIPKLFKKKKAATGQAKDEL